MPDTIDFRARTAFARTLKHLLTTPVGGLYMGWLLLAASLLTALVNLGWGDPSFAVHVQYLSLLVIPALPLVTKNAFSRNEADAAHPQIARMRTGQAAGYLAFGLIACAPLAVYPALVAPTAEAFTGMLGFAAFAAMMLSVCLLIAARVRRGAFWWAIAAMVGFRLLPELAAILPGRVGAAIGRVLMNLSPYALLTPFVNGLLDLRALLIAAAVCALCVARIRRCGNWTRDLRAALLFAVCVLLIFVQPLTLTVLDMNAAQPTLLSGDMALSLTGLRAPVTVYQVAQVGSEDVWVRDYLKKLAERHTHVTYRAAPPNADARIAALALEDNSLIVENEDEWVVVNAADLYQSAQTLTGTWHTFELEGALLTAISEATAIDLTYGGVPRGRPMDVTPLALDGARKGMVLAWLIGAPSACLASAIICLWRRRRRDHA